jgi:putative DNA primase/helicase
MTTKKDLEEELDQAQKMMTWALKSESAPRVNAMLDLARSEPGIPVLPEELDRDPWLLNCPNGTLELQTGKLREHRRENYVTKLCPTEYHQDAPCPTWESFLASILPATGDAAEEPGDTELIGFLQRLLGYCLTGDVSEHILPILWGCGANGKSTLVNAVMGVLGTDYVLKANHELLTLRSGGRHPTEQAQLHGKRLVVASESAAGELLDESLVKDLTGGEPITARRMKGDFWTFWPTHKVWLLTNHKPHVYGNDHGIWRRLALLPFEVTFWNADDAAVRAKKLPENLRQDKRLPAKLRAEAPGILAWAVRGCLGWQRRGLDIPARVSQATGAYRDEQDRLGDFLAEQCRQAPDLRVRAQDLWQCYLRWCDSSNEKKPLSRTAFGEHLTAKGFRRFTNNGTWYEGLDLCQPEAWSGTEPRNPTEPLPG